MRQITDRHQRVRAVFDEALPQAAAAREAYLDRACAGDPEFRSDVMRLLEAQQETRTLLERSADRSPTDAPVDQHFPDTPRFRVLQPPFRVYAEARSSLRVPQGVW